MKNFLLLFLLISVSFLPCDLVLAKSVPEVTVKKEAEEKPDIKILKLKIARVKEDHPYEDRRKIDNIHFRLKYRVRSRNTKRAALTIYVMRKHRDKITAYKKEDTLKGRFIERGIQEKDLIQQFDDGDYTEEKYGPIVKLRVEIWYPESGGTLIAALEEPKPRKKKKKKLIGLMAKNKKEENKEPEITWWQKIEYGAYYE